KQKAYAGSAVPGCKEGKVGHNAELSFSWNGQTSFGDQSPTSSLSQAQRDVTAEAHTFAKSANVRGTRHPAERIPCDRRKGANGHGVLRFAQDDRVKETGG